MRNKPERIAMFKKFAMDLAILSKCNERKVAAIIVDEAFSQVLSIGINGGAKGLDDCMCVTDGKYGCLHAEINALVKCTSEVKGKIMFSTLAPCKQCAAAIINAPGSFGRIYYIENWKEENGLKLLERAGIAVIKI